MNIFIRVICIFFDFCDLILSMVVYIDRTNNKGGYELRSRKKGVVLPFLSELNKEGVKVDFNSDISSDQQLNNKNNVLEDNNKNIIDNEIKTDELVSDELYELNVPINIIYSAVQLIEQNIKYNFEKLYDEKTNNSINSIKQNCLRLIKLLNNSFDLAKINEEQLSLNLSRVNIVEIVENITDNISKMLNEKQLDVIFDTNEEEKIVSCDVGKIEKVVLNIISNVVKYSNTGEKIYINISAKDNNVILTISYRGEKIKKTEINLSKYIIELHGGVMNVNQEENNANIITIELASQNNDSVYNLHSYSRIMDIENLNALINIEFSDQYNIGWK